MVQITYNLNKIKVQTSMANSHFGTIFVYNMLQYIGINSNKTASSAAHLSYRSSGWLQTNTIDLNFIFV